MSELESIQAVLRQASRRRRMAACWRGVWFGLFVGGCIWLLTLGLYKVVPIPSWVLWWGAGVAGTVWLAVPAWWGWRRFSMLETARWLDQQERLQERLSTALELSQAGSGTEWRELIVRDAAGHVAGVDARRLLPLSLPGIGRWALLVLLLGCGLGFVPAYRSKAHLRRQQEKANIQEVARNLAELTRRDLAQRPPVFEPTEKVLEGVVEAAERLSRTPQNRSAALSDLADVRKSVEEQARQLENNPGLKSLERAARERVEAGGRTAELERQMKTLQEALGKAGMDPEKLDRLQKEMQKLRGAASNLGDQKTAAGAAAKAQMGQALAQLAQEARDAGVSLPALEEAITALEGGQTDVFLRDIDTAMKDLDKMRQMAKAMQELSQQVAKVGKDLAEQLAKGQAEAASATLQKMVEQLQMAGLPADQLGQILEEVRRGVEPGKEYGQVADHLSRAVQRMQEGDRAQAAQSLAAAAEELQQMVGQMQDLQGLQSTLDALARAQAAVGKGKSWSQVQGTPCAACNGAGCAQCRGRTPGWGQGGRLGAGVGTWAEETGWSYFPEEQQAVDNSGVVRPTMDPRGVTDRGEGKLNPNLLPDKVPGKMSAGGSMPSITLKGVSIVGQSTVEFEEAAAAAQNEAQSALNQDRVPRAYRSAVRDYFDDIKR